MVEITISIDEKGHFQINIPEGISGFEAIGILDVAKDIVRNGKQREVKEETQIEQ